jgi:hypothetical protein
VANKINIRLLKVNKHTIRAFRYEVDRLAGRNILTLTR